MSYSHRRRQRRWCYRSDARFRDWSGISERRFNCASHVSQSLATGTIELFAEVIIVSDSCLMLDYVRVINFLILIVILSSKSWLCPFSARNEKAQR